MKKPKKILFPLLAIGVIMLELFGACELMRPHYDTYPTEKKIAERQKRLISHQKGKQLVEKHGIKNIKVEPRLKSEITPALAFQADFFLILNNGQKISTLFKTDSSAYFSLSNFKLKLGKGIVHGNSFFLNNSYLYYPDHKLFVTARLETDTSKKWQDVVYLNYEGVQERKYDGLNGRLESIKGFSPNGKDGSKVTVNYTLKFDSILNTKLLMVEILDHTFKTTEMLYLSVYNSSLKIDVSGGDGVLDGVGGNGGLVEVKHSSNATKYLNKLQINVSGGLSVNEAGKMGEIKYTLLK